MVVAVTYPVLSIVKTTYATFNMGLALNVNLGGQGQLVTEVRKYFTMLTLNMVSYVLYKSL